MATSEALVRVTRGGAPESVHAGALAMVEDGRTVFARGDPARVVYYRSASKPLQALELVRGGAADAFGLTDAEVAVAAGSHSAEGKHLDAVRSILEKSGVPEAALRCGGHRSVNPDVAFAQRRDGVPVSSILSNCSGKHAGMLAAAEHRGAPLEGYQDLGHPVQQAILAHVAAFAGLPASRVLAGVDGCGAPALAVPLDAMARSIARAGAADAPGARLSDDLVAAALRVRAAMLAHPDMVAGTDRFDTDLMVAGAGRLLAKAGAEGVHVVAVPERRLGLAVKVDDGNDRGYRAVVVELLRRERVLDDAAADALRKKHCPAVIANMAGAAVGTLDVAF